MTTFAGSGSEGSANGTGLAASFNTPLGIAVDSIGNLYVADSGNNKIRKITSTGVVTTLAGSGLKSSVDGSATTASFSNPSGVAVDSGGNVYISDRDTHKIRKIVVEDVSGGSGGNATAVMVTVAGGTLPSSSGLAGQVVAAFQIGKYEVTWGEWKTVRDWAVANNKGYDLTGVGNGTASTHPVTKVSWYDVVKWSNARSEKEGLTPVYQVSGATYKTGAVAPTVNATANGYRLPSEKEWEWAARGGVQTHGYTYSGSNTISEVGWTNENSSDGTKAVGTKAANELGIYDMSGNVWEWCEDVAYTSNRRIRGGGWGNDGGLAAVAYRDSADYPDGRYGSVGFRLVRSSGN